MNNPLSRYTSKFFGEYPKQFNKLLNIILIEKDIEEEKKIKKVLQKVYGRDSVVTFYGDTSERDRQIAQQRLNNGDARFFVANPQTAGRGLTLNTASNVIYYANDFNLESRIQSEARCHRIGQKNTVLYVDLVAKGTVDEHIVKSLKSKNELSARSLGEDVREWLK